MLKLIQEKNAASISPAAWIVINFNRHSVVLILLR